MVSRPSIFDPAYRQVLRDLIDTGVAQPNVPVTQIVQYQPNPDLKYGPFANYGQGSSTAAGAAGDTGIIDKTTNWIDDKVQTVENAAVDAGKGAWDWLSNSAVGQFVDNNIIDPTVNAAGAVYDKAIEPVYDAAIEPLIQPAYEVVKPVLDPVVDFTDKYVVEPLVKPAADWAWDTTKYVVRNPASAYVDVWKAGFNAVDYLRQENTGQMGDIWYEQSQGKEGIGYKLYEMLPWYRRLPGESDSFSDGLQADLEWFTGGGIAPFVDTAPEEWAKDPVNKDRIKAAYENGIQYTADADGKLKVYVIGIDGAELPNQPKSQHGDAVYSLYQHDSNPGLIKEILQGTVEDPLFWATLAAGGAGAWLKGFIASTEAVQGMTRGTQAARIALRGVEAFNVAQDLPIKQFTWPAGKIPGVRQAGTKVGGFLGRTIFSPGDAAKRAAAEEEAAAFNATRRGVQESEARRAASATDLPTGTAVDDEAIPAANFGDRINPARRSDIPDVDPVNPDLSNIVPTPPRSAPTPEGAQSLLQRLNTGLKTRNFDNGMGMVTEKKSLNVWINRIAADNPEAWARMAPKLEETVTQLQEALARADTKVERQFLLRKWATAIAVVAREEGVDLTRYARNGHDGFFPDLAVFRKGNRGNRADTFSREGLTEALLHADQPPSGTLDRQSIFGQAWRMMVARGELREVPLTKAQAANLLERIKSGTMVQKIMGKRYNGAIFAGGGKNTNDFWKYEFLPRFEKESQTALDTMARDVVVQAPHLGGMVPAHVGIQITNKNLKDIAKRTFRLSTGEEITGEAVLDMIGRDILQQQNDAYAYFQRVQLARKEWFDAVPEANPATRIATRPEDLGGTDVPGPTRPEDLGGTGTATGRTPNSMGGRATNDTLRPEDLGGTDVPGPTRPEDVGAAEAVPEPILEPTPEPTAAAGATGDVARETPPPKGTGRQAGVPASLSRDTKYNRGDLGKSFDLGFADPIAAAIYRLSGKNPQKAKSYDEILTWLDDMGFTDEDIAHYGQFIRDEIKQLTADPNAPKRIMYSRSFDEVAAEADARGPRTVRPAAGATAQEPAPNSRRTPGPQVTESAPTNSVDEALNDPAPWRAADLEAARDGGFLADDMYEIVSKEVSTDIAVDMIERTSTIFMKNGKRLSKKKLVERLVNDGGDQRTIYDLYDHLIDLTDDPEFAEKVVAETLLGPEAYAKREAKRLRKEAARKSGNVLRRLDRDTYANTLNWLRSRLMYNVVTGPSAIGLDIVGDTGIMVQRGEGKAAMSALAKMRHIKHAISEQAKIADIADVTPWTDAGLNPPDFLSHGIDRAVSGRPLAARTYLIDNRAWKSFAGIWENETLKRVRHFGDAIRRYSLETDNFLKGLAEARPQLIGEIRERAIKSGLDGEAIARQFDDELSNVFSPTDVETLAQRVFDDAGIATDLRRSWVNKVNTAARDARKAQEKILFSYRMTKADEVLGKFFFFHYWQTRAVALYAETALRNPALLNVYLRSWEAIKTRAEEEGYPPEFQGYVRYMADKNGLAGYIDPIGVLTPFAVFQTLAEDNGNGPAWKKAVGEFFFVNSIVGGALAATGLHEIKGIDLAHGTPDWTASRAVTTAATNILNWVNTQVDIPFLPDRTLPNLEEKLMRVITDGANAKVRQLVPTTDWEAFNPMTADMAKMQSILYTQYEQQYGPSDTWDETTNEAYLASVTALNRGGNDEQARTARKTFWDQRMKFQLMRTLVGGTRIRSMPLDENKRLTRSTNDAIQRTAYDARDLMTGSVDAIAFKLMRDEYQSLGTPRQRELADGFNQISNADLKGAPLIEINGIPYSRIQLARLTQKERTSLAFLWVSGQGGTKELKDYWATRDVFKNDQPMLMEWDAYWQSRDAFETEAEWRADLAKRNPAYREALRREEIYLSGLSLTPKEREKRLSTWSGNDGYLAWIGSTASVYDNPLPPPTIGGLPVPPDSLEQTPGRANSKEQTPGQTETAFTSELDRLQKAEYDLKDQIRNAEQSLKARGLPVPDDWNTVMSTPAQAAEYRRLLGEDYPQADIILRHYWAWMLTVPEGGDDSLEAYVIYLTRDQPLPTS